MGFEDIRDESGKLIKERANKPMWQLLDLNIIGQIVEVLTFGAGKYHAESWKGVPPQEYWAALMRHLCAHQAGERVDKESGLPHLAHAACDLYFLMWFNKERDQND